MRDIADDAAGHWIGPLRRVADGVCTGCADGERCYESLLDLILFQASYALANQRADLREYLSEGNAIILEYIQSLLDGALARLVDGGEDCTIEVPVRLSASAAAAGLAVAACLAEDAAELGDDAAD